MAHAAVEYAEVRERNKVRIKTKINKRDVQVRDYYPMHDKVESARKRVLGIIMRPAWMCVGNGVGYIVVSCEL